MSLDDFLVGRSRTDRALLEGHFQRVGDIDKRTRARRRDEWLALLAGEAARPIP